MYNSLANQKMSTWNKRILLYNDKYGCKEIILMTNEGTTICIWKIISPTDYIQ
jgi:hypothetical protein